MIVTTRIAIIRKLNFAINFIIILFFTFVISSTTEKICDSFQARSFLEKAQYLPVIPWKLPVYASGFMILLGVSNFIKGYLIKKQKMGVTILLVIDFFACIMITFYLNFSYRGIFLLLIANFIYYISNNQLRIWMLVIALSCYIIFDYDILSNRLVILSINEYINYYSNNSKFYIQACKNIFSSLNDIGFIIFIYFLLQNKINENKDIRLLNQQLQVTASELELANIQLKEYATEYGEIVKMKERNRLAREIHDILGHSLTSITTGIEACMEIIGINPELAKKQLEKILELSRKGLLDVRRSVRELKIDSLKKYELIPAIKNLVSDINVCTAVKVDVSIKGTILKLKDDEEQTIYRIIQESITNAIRHGKANHIFVDIEYVNHTILIRIKDDGIGCENIIAGFGLTHIRERVEMLNGNVSYHSVNEKGFEVNVEIAVRWGNAYD